MENNQLSHAAGNPTAGPALPAVPEKFEMIRRVTHQVIDGMTRTELKDRETVVGVLLNACNDEIEAQNSVLPKGRKWRMLSLLMPIQVAYIMSRKYVIRLIQTNPYADEDDSSANLLCVYIEEGDNQGIYLESESRFHRMIQETYYGMTAKEYPSVLMHLRNMVDSVKLTLNPDLIAVNNGIFNYRTKELLPFDPDYVFLTKSKVDYNPNATCVTVHNDADGTDWDVDSWMDELSDDPDIVHLLWQILGAIIRPNVKWNKSAWFYSESGNNGKGTLCELMRQLCGKRSCASLPLSDMGVDFKLEPLIYASAIIVDENDVGTFIDKAANLKAIITGDMLSINRKFKIPVTYAFHGFMVQCLNEMPKIKDKSDSFFRRQIFVPFTKCFTGKERMYIKDDYLKRPEVLEYVLYKILHMNYYVLDVPKSCQKALDEYKQYVDSVYAFLLEMMDQFVWNLLPWPFLYDLYCAWYKQNNQGNQSGIMGSAVFIKDVKQKIASYYSDTWKVIDGRIRPGNRMSMPEPMIAKYDLQNWMNPLYLNSKDVDKKCIPVLADKYRGLERV